MASDFYTFILASKRHGALYVDTTDDLVNTVLDHKCNLVSGVTRCYAINQLVYYEFCKDENLARMRAEAIKNMHRIWKIDLIEHVNPHWRDLYSELSGRATSCAGLASEL